MIQILVFICALFTCALFTCIWVFSRWIGNDVNKMTKPRIQPENCICKGYGYIQGGGDTPILECPDCTAGLEASEILRNALSGNV
jgi:hypothetical protein